MKTFRRFAFPRRLRDKAGMALVVSLAIIVLLTAAVLAFFVRATANRRVEASRANRVEAEQLAETAVDYAIARFLGEISDPANSTTDTNNNIVAFQPKAATNAIPVRKFAAAIGTADTNYFNLVRQSIAAADPNASAHSTATTSKNGRTVGTSRWNAPALLAGAGFTATDQLPNWIYVTPNGSATNAASADIIGRFAYNVYNAGGLLDANVAGYPSSVTNAPELKGSAAGADLTQLGISTNDINALVVFRNPQSTNAAPYLDNVHASARKGFLKSMVTSASTGTVYANKHFAGRQDLLRYARTQNTGLTNALPYLTTDSSTLNAPIWGPKVNLGGVFDYKAEADSTTAVIRNLSKVRVTAPFVRDDGSTAAPGEPLLKQRFPLSRLALLSPAASAADMLKYFGLTWDPVNDCWFYNHGNDAKIYTLEEVAAAQREPDFFELLKAVTLNGSLGRDPGPTAADINALGVAGNGFGSYSSYPDSQIIQIGASIMDQYDADYFPTAIYFNEILAVPGEIASVARIMRTAYGIENLPYLFRTVNIDYKIDNSSGRVGGWIQPIIWNPHGKPPTTPLLASSLRPQNFRLNTYGNISFQWRQDLAHDGPLSTFDGGPAGQIVFTWAAATANSMYTNPNPLTWTSASVLDNKIFETSSAGVFIGSPADSPDPAWVDPRAATDPNFNGNLWCQHIPSPDITFVLEYQDASGAWHPYTRYARLMVTESSLYQTDTKGTPDPTDDILIGNKNGVVGHTHTDPRTDRFSVSQSVLFRGDDNKKTESLNPSANTTGLNTVNWATKVLPLPGSFVLIPAPMAGVFNDIEYGDLFRNIPAGSASYRDVDGVVRPADGGQANKATGEGCLPYGGNGRQTHASRPIVLNRAFQSVGEMAYAFRDLPFKSLDFSSNDSADLGLLDVFCLEEETSLIAGQVNANTAPVPVLKALLSGAIKKERMDTALASYLTAAEANTLATGLANRIASTNSGEGPILDRADLAMALAAVVQSGGTAVDKANKNLREAALRALASVSDTRTWNLFIDVIAQAGSLPPGQTAPGSFLVNGEKRCWLHLAIDRYTGKIVSKKLEAVYE